MSEWTTIFVETLGVHFLEWSVSFFVLHIEGQILCSSTHLVNCLNLFIFFLFPFTMKRTLMFPQYARRHCGLFGRNNNKVLVVLKCSAVFQTQFSDLHSDVVEGAGCPASLPLSFGRPLRPVCTFHSSDVLLSWFEKQESCVAKKQLTIVLQNLSCNFFAPFKREFFVWFLTP